MKSSTDKRREQNQTCLCCDHEVRADTPTRGILQNLWPAVFESVSYEVKERLRKDSKAEGN